MQRWRKAYNLMLCHQNENRLGFFFLEFGFVGKKKGNEKQKKGKAYNLMQCDQKTRTGRIFYFLFFIFFGNLVLLKNRSRSRVLILIETNGKGKRL